MNTGGRQLFHISVIRVDKKFGDVVGEKTSLQQKIQESSDSVATNSVSVAAITDQCSPCLGSKDGGTR